MCLGIDQAYIRWTIHGESDDSYRDWVHVSSGVLNEFDTIICNDDDGFEEC